MGMTNFWHMRDTPSVLDNCKNWLPFQVALYPPKRLKLNFGIKTSSSRRRLFSWVTQTISRWCRRATSSLKHITPTHSRITASPSGGRCRTWLFPRRTTSSKRRKNLTNWSPNNEVCFYRLTGQALPTWPDTKPTASPTWPRTSSPCERTNTRTWKPRKPLPPFGQIFWALPMASSQAWPW